MNAEQIIKGMKKRGKHLAVANKACEGTPNKNGEFYRCLKRKLKS